jgi:spore coat polysaccharide biosynthesis protein SpsF (cytidylyltransferase family)
MRRFGGTSLLHWVTRRTTESQYLDRVVVLLGDEPADYQVAAHAPADVAVVHCQEPDPMGRVVRVADRLHANDVVLVGIDTPFIDPALVDRLMAAVAEGTCDYASYCSQAGRLAIQSRLGLVAQWCRVAALREADGKARDPRDRRSVTRYIYSRPEEYRIKLLPIPRSLDREDFRLAILTEDDWDRAQMIIDALGPEGLDWQRIADLLDDHPGLRQSVGVAL